MLKCAYARYKVFGSFDDRDFLTVLILSRGHYTDENKYCSSRNRFYVLWVKICIISTKFPYKLQQSADQCCIGNWEDDFFLLCYLGKKCVSLSIM